MGGDHFVLRRSFEIFHEPPKQVSSGRPWQTAGNFGEYPRNWLNTRLRSIREVDVTKTPFGADPTGRTDSTAALQAAIGVARDHQMVCFFPPICRRGIFGRRDSPTSSRPAQRMSKRLITAHGATAVPTTPRHSSGPSTKTRSSSYPRAVMGPLRY
jgi:hypothetical protein